MGQDRKGAKEKTVARNSSTRSETWPILSLSRDYKFSDNWFIPLSAGPEGEIRVRRTVGVRCRGFWPITQPKIFYWKSIVTQRRILRAIKSLKHGVTVAELAAAEGCRPRTIWRDPGEIQGARKTNSRPQEDISISPTYHRTYWGFMCIYP